MKRKRTMLLRFTDEELESITAKARKAGLSRESYCRQVLNGTEVREAPTADVLTLIREMRRVGGNIHQLLRTANAIGLVDVPRLREEIDELRSVDKLITDAYTAKVDLFFIFKEYLIHGLGLEAWRAIERECPETLVWELITPYFEQRYIHFYVNKCGFHIVEYFNKYHPDPDMPPLPPKDEQGQRESFDDGGCFRFIKEMGK